MAQSPTTTAGLNVAATSRADWRTKIELATRLCDLTAIAIAMTMAVLVRFGSTEHAPVYGLTSVDYTSASLALIIAWMVSLHAVQAYRPELIGVGADEYARVLRATFWTFGVVAIVSMIFKLDIARGYLAVALPTGLVLLLLERALLRYVVVRKRVRGKLSERALIIGAAPEVRRAARAIRRNPAAGYVVHAVSVASADGPDFELADGQRIVNIGPIIDAGAAAYSVGADVLIVAGQSTVRPREMREYGWQLEGTPIKLVLASSMIDVAGPRIHRRPIEGLPLMAVESPHYAGTKFLVKRTMDVVLSGLALIVLSPVFAAIAIAIHREDHGPVMFRQTRVGMNGKLFRITKFRSMVVDAEALRATLTSDVQDGVLFKQRSDPRITRTGRFIRGYSLDELPQLLDVFLGHMSLVGPRPPLPEEVSQYADHVRRRLNVKPGVTGPWQVGGRSNLTWEETVQKDLYYVENWSVVGDISIMIRTVRAVLQRDGAY
ncbi:sugar transferase [Rudaeicoccus suwonensis]|uniref:sugar transferase n=1 Tax=Rudaeicoccus suwonensis TaxID=657409 RepID=UPI0014773B70|nr:sugar transferase [Rudaeicoccus suwonensis]